MKRMLMTLNYHLSSRSRQIKLDHFWRLLAPFPNATVLNLGATPPHQNRTLLGIEQGYLIEQPEQDHRWSSLRVIGGNIDRSSMEEYSRIYRGRSFHAAVLDGCRLPFADQSFDIVFSNAVIEHLVPDAQHKMAEEIMRVGRAWFVTTPNFWYPIELHNKLPFIHFLPTRARLSVQRRLHTWPEEDPLNLLSASNLAALFPNSTILKVRVTFYPETLIAFGRSPVRPQASKSARATALATTQGLAPRGRAGQVGS
jgi:hypothetical protein